MKSDGEWRCRSTDEPLVSESSHFELEIAAVKLQRHKSPSTEQIPAELIEAGGETLHVLRSSFSLTLFGLRKNCLSKEAVH
jgi:hypothetical protein